MHTHTLALHKKTRVSAMPAAENQAIGICKKWMEGTYKNKQCKHGQHPTVSFGISAVQLVPAAPIQPSQQRPANVKKETEASPQSTAATTSSWKNVGNMCVMHQKSGVCKILNCQYVHEHRTKKRSMCSPSETS